jgi:zinc transport system ATP-binding protein
VPVNGAPPFLLRGGRVVIGSRAALDEVDFRLESGEFLALLGGNGAGKTTLVKVLLGLLPISAGTVELFATPLDRFQDWHRIGYLPQRFTAASGVPATVREVVATGRLARTGMWRRPGTDDREAVRRALEIVGLRDRERDSLETLSGGQQQRVLIARALTVEPDVLVLDEPASGIDVESQEALAGALKVVREQGRSVLLVAHGLGAMEPLVDRTVVLEAGRVIYEGAPLVPSAELRHLHLHPDQHREEPHVHHHRHEEDR